FAEFVRNEWGLGPGDRVALLAHNSSDYFEILWGCAKAEVLLVCLNWRLAVPELAFIFRDATPTALIYDPAFAEAARDLIRDAGIAKVICLDSAAQAGEIAYEDALASSS